MSGSTARILSGMCSTLIFMALLLPAAVFAIPVEVTFFPNTARVKEISKLRLEPAANGLKKTVFVLPGQAEPDSLVIYNDAKNLAVIENQTWKRITSRDEETIRDLKKKIDELKEARIKIVSGIKALDTQIQFWQMQTKAKFKTLMDAANMSSALGKNIKKSMMEKLALEPELEKLDKQIAQLNEELKAAGGKREDAWEITVLLSGAQGSDMTLHYVYSLSGCGWIPNYRLEARPFNSQVLFSWEGEIWQSSGRDWSQVLVNLANFQPKTVLAPQDIPPWIIKPRPAPVPVGTPKKARSQRSAEAQAAADMDVDAAAASAPLLKQEGIYTSWSLGKRSVPAGARQKIKIQDEVWPGEFAYLCRPSQGEQVFVRAMVKFNETREIPRGNAVILIDGAMVGKRTFALSSREEAIFFGNDPMIRAKSTLLSQKSGEKTLFQDKQTYARDIRIDLENNRNYAVKMRIEEPMPQSRDERIKITLKNDPLPAQQSDAVQTWVLDIPALEKRKIFSGVWVEAPRDMVLDLGWHH